MKRREYGRQQNSTLTNSMNNILIDSPHLHLHFISQSVPDIRKKTAKT
jgi:hypothetical protein